MNPPARIHVMQLLIGSDVTRASIISPSDSSEVGLDGLDGLDGLPFPFAASLPTKKITQSRRKVIATFIFLVESKENSCFDISCLISN